MKRALLSTLKFLGGLLLFVLVLLLGPVTTTTGLAYDLEDAIAVGLFWVLIAVGVGLHSAWKWMRRPAK